MGGEGLEQVPETLGTLEFESGAANALHAEFPELLELLRLFPQLPERARMRCRRRVRQIVVEARASAQ